MKKLSGFDWVWCESVWNWYEIGWLNFEYIGIFLKLWYLMRKKKKLNGFDWVWCESVWIWYEIGWLNFEYIGIFETLIFDEKKKMISPIWNENFWSMNYINISYWAVSSFPIVENFSSTLSSGEEWWLGWGMVIIRIWLRILCWILFNC